MPVTISKVSDIVVKTSGKTASQTRTTPIILHSDDQGLISWSMLGNGQQTGTPTPDAPIMPQFVGVRTGNLWDGKSTLVLPDIGTRYGFYCAAGDYSVRNDSENIVYMFWNSGRSRSGAAQPHTTATITLQNDGATGFFMPYNDASLSNITIVDGSDIPSQQIPYGYALPITCAGQTTPVYLGQVSTVRKIGKLVFDGTEEWSADRTDNFYSPVISGAARNSLVVCSHQTSTSTSLISENCFISSTGRFNITTTAVEHTTTAWKQFLSDEYAAGTPVTVWYVLATPETAIVNEPIAKIGDYCDELRSESTTVTIPTANGENTLTVDTTLQPSSMTVTYNSPEYSKCVRVCDAQGRPSLGIHFGFKIDKSKTDSDQAIIYTHDAVTMTPAYMDFTNGVFNYGSWGNVWFVKNARPCKLNYNGTVAYYLDPNDYTKKADGTDSGIFYTLLDEEPYDWSTQWKQYYHLDNGEYVLNSDAEAPTFAEDTYYRLDAYSDHYMVEFPKVYFKRYEDENYNYIEVSDRKLDPYFHAYAHINADGEELDYIYLPMFKGSFSGSDDALMSLPGIVPPGGTSDSFEVEGAEANGDGWQIWDHSSREMINDLLVLMSKNADAQAKFGKGRESGYNASDTTTYGKLQTGTLIKKGAFYGYNTSYSDVKVFHIEGFWANRWERLQGLLLVDGAHKIKMTPPYNFTGTDFVTLSTPSPTSNNYARTLATSEYGSVTATVSAYASSPFKDYFYQNQSGTRVGLVGGFCNNGSACGPRCVHLGFGASSSNWNIGASPIYKPLL